MVTDPVVEQADPSGSEKHRDDGSEMNHCKQFEGGEVVGSCNKQGKKGLSHYPSIGLDTIYLFVSLQSYWMTSLGGKGFTAYRLSNAMNM